MKNTSTRKGFTLIELLIVITIIGILAAALLPNIIGATARGRDTARVSNLNQLITALELYNSDNGSYPDPVNGKCIDEAAIKQYIKGGQVPHDPNGKSVNGCNTPGTYYYCRLNGNGASYLLAAKMEIVGGNANALEDQLTNSNCDGSEPAPTAFSEGSASDIYFVMQ